MILNEKEWRRVDLYAPEVIENKYYISKYGEIYDGDKIYKPDYPSSNGYNYTTFMTKDGKHKLFPIDMLMVFAFDIVGIEFEGKHIRVEHKDGNTRNDYLSNLEVVEDVEIWVVSTFPRITKNKYEVSNFGRVKIIETGKIIAPIVDKRYGYVLAHVKLSNGKNGQLFVHRLVAWDFIPERRDEQLDVNHIDGTKTHNRPRNLEWVTRSENICHAFATELNMSKGETSKLAKFNNELIDEMCRKLVEYSGDIEKVVEYFSSIGNFAVSRWNVECVKYKKKWVEISDKYFDKDTFKGIKKKRSGLPKLNPEKVKLVCQTLVKNNMSVYDTYKELKDTMPELSHSIVYKIKSKYNWKEISDKYF